MNNKLPFTLTALTLSTLLLAGCADAETSSDGVSASASAPMPTATSSKTGDMDANNTEATDDPTKGTVSTAPKDESTGSEATKKPSENPSAAGPSAPATSKQDGVDTPKSDGDDGKSKEEVKKRFTTSVEGDVKLSNNIPLKGVSKNEHGKYAQTTVRLDKEYMRFNDTVASDALKKAIKNKAVSVEEVGAIQRQVMTFVAEEGLDSELNGGKDVNTWWKANKNKIHTDFTAKVKSDLEAKDGGTFLVRPSTDADYIYNPDHARMTTRDLSLQNVHYSKSGEYTALMFTVDFSMAMPVEGKGAEEITDLTSGTLTYSMIKDGKTWKFGAWDNSYQTKQIQG